MAPRTFLIGIKYLHLLAVNNSSSSSILRTVVLLTPLTKKYDGAADQVAHDQFKGGGGLMTMMSS